MKNYLAKAKRYMVSGDVDEAQYSRVVEDINKANYHNLQVFSVITLVFMLAVHIISYIFQTVSENRIAYIWGMSAAIVIIFFTWFVVPKYEKMLLPVVYAFVNFLLWFSIYLGTVPGADQLIVSFIVFVVVVPTLFTDRSYRFVICIIFNCILAIVMAYRYKPYEVYSVDRFDIIVYGLVSCIVCTYMMKVKTERHYYVWKNRYLSEMDLLTDLRNRNCYERNLKKYPANCENSVYCIYVDVNGLHEMNNLKGHDAGDAMLKQVANSLKENFADADIYRIGGDEFVVFGMDIDNDAVLNKIQVFSKQIEEHDYHVAIGMEYTTDTDTDVYILIKKAEKKMYADKQAYYEMTGYERK